MSFFSTHSSPRIRIESLQHVVSANDTGRTKAEVCSAYSTDTSSPLTKPTTTSEAIESQNKGEMASDEDYASFLDKANEDPNKGVAKTQGSGKIQLKAVDQGAKVPAGLKNATKDAFYTSDADEPFEPVVLKHSGKSLPNEGRLSLPSRESRFAY